AALTPFRMLSSGARTGVDGSRASSSRAPRARAAALSVWRRARDAPDPRFRPTEPRARRGARPSGAIAPRARAPRRRARGVSGGVAGRARDAAGAHQRGVDRAGGVADLPDRPDDQRLAAAGVAAREDAVHAGSKARVVRVDVAALAARKPLHCTARVLLSSAASAATHRSVRAAARTRESPRARGRARG